MSTSTTATTPTADLAAVKARQQVSWAAGDYSAVGARLVSLSEELCELAGITAGEQVLDVACGNGNAALAAARRFADVTGIDYVPALLEEARRRAAGDRLEVTFVEGDAERLDFPDDAFDVVISAVGAMFAPDQPAVAAELLRVCRPGGRVALASWCHDGFVGELFATLGAHLPPPPGTRPPTRWGTESGARDLLAGARSVRCERRPYTMHFASPEHYVEYMAAHYGPMVKAFEAVGPDGHHALYADVVAVARRFDRGGGSSLQLACDWLAVVADC